MLALAEGGEAENPVKASQKTNKQTHHILTLQRNRTLAILVKVKLPAHCQDYGRVRLTLFWNKNKRNSL